MTDLQPSLLDFPQDVFDLPVIADKFLPEAQAVLYHGDCIAGLADVPVA
ncbi:MAG: hypothetical protein M3Y13_06590 [Armatimonadota bacterium]|nr:hypothetical protein [Armatimonadota bacterium]